MQASEITKFFLGALALIITLSLSACTHSVSGGGSASGNSDDSGAANSFDQLSVGDVQSITFDDQGKATLAFGDNNNDTYMVILNSTATDDTVYPVQLNASAASSISTSTLSAVTVDGIAAMLPAMAMEEVDANENPMHDLMEVAAIIASESLERLPGSSLQAAAVTTQLEVGSQKRFKVLNSLASVTSYELRETTLRYASDKIYIYVDNEVIERNPTDLEDDDIAELAEKFEQNIMPSNQRLFGVESDINQDGRIAIVLSNMLNQISSNGIVTGLFNPIDLHYHDASNQMEVFFGLVPDCQGLYGPVLCKDFVLNNVLPGVLAHEYQHMISFNTHVFLFEGRTERAWLNEGLSHFAECETGNCFENFPRVKLFLQSPNKTPVVSNGIPTLAERGAAFAFIQYMVEQAKDGDAFIRRLLLTDKTGVENLEAAFDGNVEGFSKFSEYLKQWTIALALSETGLTDDPRYNYKARTIHPITGNYEGLCIRCEAFDGRNTILSGPNYSNASGSPAATNIHASATQFVQLTSPDAVITIDSSKQASMGGSVIHFTQN
jgi:hypothetical protein